MLADIDAELTRLTEARRTIAALLEAAGDEGLPGDMDVNTVLHNRSHTSRVNSNNMHADHRLAISEGAKNDPFSKAIRAAKPTKFTQNTLAKAVRIPASLLSMYRKGLRKIPLSRAKEIQALTGWPADAKHWPGGIVSDA